MGRRGRTMYVPAIVIAELDDITREDRLPSIKAEAWRELVKYGRVGRETKRIMQFDFSRKMRLPPVQHLQRKKRSADAGAFDGVF